MRRGQKLKVVLADFLMEGYGLYPFGLYSLRSFAAGQLNDVDITVLTFRMETSIEDAVDSIVALTPDVVGLTCFVWSEQKVHATAKRIRENISYPIILLGGPQIEVGDPVIGMLLEQGYVDAAVCGEGEVPFTEILRRVQNNENTLTNIPGASVFDSNRLQWGKPQVYGKYFQNSTNPVVDDKELLSVALQSGVFVYESARGCPYSCTFCDQGIKSFRSRPMEQIESHINAILSHRPKAIVFLDSTFNISPARTRQLLSPIIKSGVKVAIGAEVKPERCDPETIELMKQAGFKTIEVGLQSIKSGTLQFIKRSNDFVRIERSIKLLLESGIDVHVDTIIGLPGESLTDWLETIDYCYSLGDVEIFSNTLKILPNAELKSQILNLNYQYTRKRNCAVVNTDKMSQSDIVTAKLYQKMIKLFWNKASEKSVVRDVVDKYYRGRLSKFAGDALAALSEGATDEILKHSSFWHERNSYERSVA